MKKIRVMLFFIIIVGVLLILPNMCNAATTINATETTKTSTGKTVKWSYELNNENEIVNLLCTNVSNISGEVTIPSTIDGHTVRILGKEYGTGTFEKCTGLQGIKIPETVTIIGDHAFEQCSGLKSITIPNSITSIGNYAFRQCTGIKKVVIPDSVTSIGREAFYGCSGINSLTLSKNLTCINELTFYKCSGLTSVIIPNNVTTIFGDSWNGAFERCTNLSKVLIPDSVASIKKYAFGDCEKLTIYGNDGQASKQYAEDNKIKFDYIANWDKKDEGTDITAPTVKGIEIKESSVRDYYNSTSNRFEIPRGATITINVNFSEDIKGSTAPTLKIKCGTGSEISLSNGVVSGKSCIYTYEIKAGDDGLITAVSLTGGNITDIAGNQAELSCPKLVVQYHSDSTAYANSKTEEIKDDNQDNEDGKEENTDQDNKEDQDDSKKDPTIKDDAKLPQTGATVLTLIGIAISVVAGISKIKYNKYKDI